MLKNKWPVNTGNAKRHYEAHHENVLRELAEDAISSGKPFSDTILATSLVSSVDLGKQLATIDKFFPKSGLSQSSAFNLGPKRGPTHLSFDKDECRRLMLRAITQRNLPFGTFDYPEVKDLLTYLAARKIPSSSRHVMRRGLNTEFSYQLGVLRELLAKTESRFAITMDEWYSGNHQNFLGVTLHFYTNNFELKDYYIGFEALKEPSLTGAVIYKHLLIVLEEHGIKDRVLSITRDNAATIDVAVQKFSDYYEETFYQKFDKDIRCAGHVFNLSTTAFLTCTFFKQNTSEKHQALLKNFVEENPFWANSITVERMLALPQYIRDICYAVTHRSYFRNHFATIVAERKGRLHNTSGPERLLRDNDTRWLSTYYMLDRFLYFKDEVTLLLLVANRENKRLINVEDFEFTDIDWKYLTDVRDFLEIFKVPTLKLQASNYPTINWVIPLVDLIFKDLEGFDPKGNPLIKLGVNRALEKLSQYFPLRQLNFKSMETYCVATVLDPRFKLEIFKEMGLSKADILIISKFFHEAYGRYKLEYEERKKESEKVIRAAKRREQPRRFINDSSSESEIDVAANRIFAASNGISSNQTEAEAYLSQTRLEFRKKNITSYYKEKEDEFPVLSCMARDYFAIPAMSAPAEALFSRIGKLVTKTRNRLSTDTIRSLAILKSRGIIPDDRSSGVQFNLNNIETEEEPDPESESEPEVVSDSETNDDDDRNEDEVREDDDEEEGMNDTNEVVIISPN